MGYDTYNDFAWYDDHIHNLASEKLDIHIDLDRYSVLFVALLDLSRCTGKHGWTVSSSYGGNVFSSYISR